MFTPYFHTWHEHQPMASTPRSSQRDPCLPTTGRRQCRVLTQCLAADLLTLSAQQQQDGPQVSGAIGSWSLPAEAASFCRLSRFGVYSVNRTTGFCSLIREGRQCFEQCVGLMRPVRIRNELADPSHNSWTIKAQSPEVLIAEIIFHYFFFPVQILLLTLLNIHPMPELMTHLKNL